MEGTPLAVLEASASGLAIISTNHAGIPDVVVDEKTGLLSDEHDVVGMAQNMERLLSNKTLAKHLGHNGKQHIKANYSLERHIESLQNTLSSSMGHV